MLSGRDFVKMSDGRMSRTSRPVDVEAFANMAIICGQCRGGGAMWEKISIWQRLEARHIIMRPSAIKKISTNMAKSVA